MAYEEKITGLPTARDTWHIIAANARNATWRSGAEYTRGRKEAARAILGNRRLERLRAARKTENE